MYRKHLSRPPTQKPPPQVPRTVREVLKDYPEVIEDLQDGLTTTHYGSRGPIDFERAVWMLEDMLGGRMGNSFGESDRAKARGDLEAADQADKKARALARAGRSIHADDDLWDYFQTYERTCR